MLAPNFLLILAWEWRGCTGGSTFADEHSPTLHSRIPGRGVHGDDVMLWEYMTAGNETPAFQSDRGTSGPSRKNGSVLFQGSELEGSHVHQDSVKREATTHGLTRDIIKKDTSMLESPRKLSENPGLNQTQFRHLAGLERQLKMHQIKKIIIESDTIPHPRIVNSIVGSSIRLSVNMNKSFVITWKYYSYGQDFLILKYPNKDDIPEINVFFNSRVKFNTRTNSLTLKNLKMCDSGLYEMLSLHFTQRNVVVNKNYFLLEVQEKLRVPQIVQMPMYTAGHVQLICFVGKGKASSILWLKDDTFLKSPRFQTVGESSTIYIEDMEVKHCGMYTCIVKNKVSTNRNSYFLTSEDILFILICVALTSIVALVSSLTTFIAAVIIIVTSKKTQDPDRQQELTTVFVIFQLVSIISLLIACLLSVFELGFALWCQITAGFGCFLSFVVIIYISILFLGLNTDEFQSFLSRKIHQSIILTCEILCLAISSILIHGSVTNLTYCRYPHQLLIVRGLMVVLGYIFPVFVFILFYIVHLQEDDMHVQMKAVRQATQQRLLSI